jgi:hypothetical protein
MSSSVVAGSCSRAELDEVSHAVGQARDHAGYPFAVQRLQHEAEPIRPVANDQRRQAPEGPDQEQHQHQQDEAGDQAVALRAEAADQPGLQGPERRGQHGGQHQLARHGPQHHAQQDRERDHQQQEKARRRHLRGHA